MKKITAFLFLYSYLVFPQNTLFYPSRFDYDMGKSPRGIVAGDFNNDNKADIVTSNKDGRNITIRLGKGDGFFEDTLKFNVGILPVSLTSADFNNDNNLDIATSNQLSNNISVLLGNGDGTFADSINYPTDETPRYIINYDFNNDSKIDLAVADRDPRSISIFLGNGDGTFQAERRFSTGNDLMPRMITTGDFNGDNKPDIAFIHAYSSPNPAIPGMLGGILEGDGEGNFNLAKTFNLGVYGSFPEAPAILTSDFNNDNKDDLAITISSGSEDNDYCLILLCMGNFNFNELPAFLVYKKPFSFIAGDYDNDNKIDLAFTNSGSNNFSFHKGNGDGTFTEITNHSTAQYSRCICAADFNNDSYIDFATGNEGGNSISLIIATGDLEFVFAPTFGVGEPPQAFPYWGASTDLNKDGNKDLVIANWGFPNQESTISVLLGNGDNTFQPKVNYDVGIAPKFVIADDFNKDNNFDIAVNNDRSHSISVLLGNGDGTLQSAFNYPVGLNPLMICAADFNEDNNIDLAAPDFNSDNIAILYGNADGNFSSAIFLPVDDGPFALITTDINNDNHADLCLANTEYNPDVQAYISVYLGDGQGSFTKVNKQFIRSSQPWMLSAGNLNNDNYVDLVCILSQTNLVFFLYGDGMGNFAIDSTGYIGGPQQAIIKDFNMDGFNDIAVTSNYNSNVRLLQGDGNGNYNPYEISFGVDGGAWGIIADDFDNDNSLDLAVTTGIFGADHISILNNEITSTGVELLPEGNLSFKLLQNYPNPFNPSTKIKFILPEENFVSLKIYDVLGNEITTLVNETKSAGEYVVDFSAADLASGIYFYSIQAGSFRHTKKLIILK